MKDGILYLIENGFVLYFYILFVRLIVEFTKKDIQNHRFCQWIFRITDPLLDRLTRFFPPKRVGDIHLNISLILLLVLYRPLLNLLLQVLDLLLL